MCPLRLASLAQDSFWRATHRVVGVNTSFLLHWDACHPRINIQDLYVTCGPQGTTYTEGASLLLSHLRLILQNRLVISSVTGTFSSRKP